MGLCISVYQNETCALYYILKLSSPALCWCCSSVLACCMNKPTTQTEASRGCLGLCSCSSGERLWVCGLCAHADRLSICGLALLPCGVVDVVGFCVVFQRPLMDHPYEEARSEWVSAPRNQRSKETPPRYAHAHTHLNTLIKHALIPFLPAWSCCSGSAFMCECRREEPGLH